MRGSALNVRFGVNGIQKASSEFGRSVFDMIKLLSPRAASRNWNRDVTPERSEPLSRFAV
jgi:hypothetical protein